MNQKGDALKVYHSDGGTFTVTYQGEAQCSTCESFIVWSRTRKNKNMPLDARPDKDGIYTSHFATCEQAAQHRRPAQRDAAPARREEPKAKDSLDAEREDAWSLDDDDGEPPYTGVPY